MSRHRSPSSSSTDTKLSSSSATLTASEPSDHSMYEEETEPVREIYNFK